MNLDKLRTDWFITTGSTHNICQDYVITGRTDQLVYTIVADGCSSSPRSEIGAKFLALSAESILLNYDAYSIRCFPYDKLGQLIIEKAATMRRALGVDFALDATLGLLISDGKDIRSYMYGDGCLIVITKHYTYAHTGFYTLNAPYYLSYYLDRERHTSYVTMHEQQDYEYPRRYSRQYVRRADSVEWEHESHDFNYYEPHEYYSPDWRDVQAVMITTDGLESFRAPGQETLGFTAVVEQATAFKNWQGAFLKRRFNKMLLEYNNNNIKPTDDLAAAVIINEECI